MFVEEMHETVYTRSHKDLSQRADRQTVSRAIFVGFGAKINNFRLMWIRMIMLGRIYSLAEAINGC